MPFGTMGKIPSSIMHILIFLLLGGCVLGGKAGPVKLVNGDHSAIINGTELRYHIFGRGPLVMALPDGPGFSYEYLRMPNLEASFTMFYLEPVGSGASGRLREGEYTVKRYVKDLESLRDSLGIERFLLMGHSFGGLVAQKYSLEYPRRLSGLVLYASTPTYGKEWKDGLSGNLKRFEGKPWYSEAVSSFFNATVLPDEEGGARVVPKVLPLYFADFDSAREEYLSYLRDLRFNPAPFRNFLMKEADHMDTRQRLVEIDFPTLIVVGEGDAITPVRFSEMLHYGIRGSRLAVIPGAGHLASIENPRGFYDIVAPFMLKAR